MDRDELINEYWAVCEFDFPTQTVRPLLLCKEIISAENIVTALRVRGFKVDKYRILTMYGIYNPTVFLLVPHSARMDVETIQVFLSESEAEAHETHVLVGSYWVKLNTVYEVGVCEN